MTRSLLGYLRVSIHPPLFRRGTRKAAAVDVIAWQFQSTPALSARGTAAVAASTLGRSFNPPPALSARGNNEVGAMAQTVV